MKKLFISVAMLSLLSGYAGAQGLLGRLGERAKSALEQKIGNKVEKGVNDMLEGNSGKKSRKKTGEEADAAVMPGTEAAVTTVSEAAVPASDRASDRKQAQVGYAKTDFVPGDEIFFDDPVENEKVGEFPLHWDFLSGEECEIITLNGEQVIKLSGWYGTIAPLMKEADYLPEEFTIEFDVW